MKKQVFSAFLFGIVIFLCAVPGSCLAQKSIKSLEAGFRTPPDTIQTSVYWYWISDHISEEGVIKDLQAMKQAGINRAFIGNIGLGDEGLKGGKVKFGTDEWWSILHTALKTATELQIEIGIFNSPGWSQSGGPWVKPEEAMRYLASVKAQVEGGKKVDITLGKPSEAFQDVKLIAYPALPGKGTTLSSAHSKITSTPLCPHIEYLADGKSETEVLFFAKDQKEISINFQADEPFTVRSLKIDIAHRDVNVPALLQVKEGETYKTLAEFTIDRYNGSPNVGFIPYAPIVISIPATTGKEFRVVVNHITSDIGFKEIELSSIPLVERYPEKTLAKMFQSPLPYWNEYQWKPQPEVDTRSLVVDPTQVVDISHCLSGDRIRWNAPKGNWIITRIGALPTGVENSPASPEATGLEIDKMSKKHAESHFNAYMGEIIKRIPANDRKTWKVIVQDSYEMGGQNFTDELPALFQKRYGYDPIPFLPVCEGVVVQSEDASDRFLWDLRKFIADKVAYDYVGGLREIAQKHGLTTWLENYGHWGFPGEFLQYGGQSNEIGGEFWAEGDLGNIENRAASSCGHIYGKTKISAESFTSAGESFGRYPALLKQRGDRFFSEGINNTLLHVYIHQPYEKEPGVNTWFGTEFTRTNTWFSHLDLFTTYLKRVNFMLQQGLNVADVAYFIGEDTPKMTGITDPELPKGYQFDYINAEVIENGLFVKDGLITLPHGTQYRMLVLPKLETMRPALLKKIKQLIEEGAVVLGPAPQRSPSYQNYPDADAEVQKLASSLWSGVDGVNVRTARIGKGLLINGMNMEQALETIHCVPDCRIPGNAPVLYGHRTSGNTDIYFITNQSGHPLDISPEFRTPSGQPELWEPTSGHIRPLPNYTPTATGTITPLKLEANESAFIVFRNNPDGASPDVRKENYPLPQILAQVNNPWKVQFDKTKRGPEYPQTWNELKDLTEHPDDDIKYYSGTLVYDNSFRLKDKPQGRVFINLNEVYVMAKVKINGQYAGGVWTAPYRVDITDLIQKGENRVEIEVVNTWVNRLIGDAKLPAGERKTWLTYTTWNADSPLQKSGLIGPVVIENIHY